MASTQSTGILNEHHDSNSPRRRSHLKAKHDPFLELAPVTPTDPAPPTPSPPDNTPDSVLSRILLSPFILISFIISLALVDRASRQYRAESSSRNTKISIFSYLNLSGWLAGPEPYQDPGDTTWGVGTPSTETVQDEKDGKWVIRKKHRKMGKMALADALDMRGTVMMWMVAGAVAVVAVFVWVCWKAWDCLT